MQVLRRYALTAAAHPPMFGQVAQTSLRNYGVHRAEVVNKAI
jgi:hypothetical protein